MLPTDVEGWYRGDDESGGKMRERGRGELDGMLLMALGEDERREEASGESGSSTSSSIDNLLVRLLNPPDELIAPVPMDRGEEDKGGKELGEEDM